jgi:glc operon protein GlcG
MRTKHVLTLAEVDKILAAARNEAVNHNWAVTIAVVDDGEHLLGLSRLDGASPVSASLAIEKANVPPFERVGYANVADRLTAALQAGATLGWLAG